MYNGWIIQSGILGPYAVIEPFGVSFLWPTSNWMNNSDYMEPTKGQPVRKIKPSRWSCGQAEVVISMDKQSWGLGPLAQKRTLFIPSENDCGTVYLTVILKNAFVQKSYKTSTVQLIGWVGGIGKSRNISNVHMRN